MSTEQDMFDFEISTKMDITPITTKKPRKKPVFTKPRRPWPTQTWFTEILQKLVFKEDFDLNQSREYGIMKKVYSLYPKMSFWNKMELGFKLHSVAWFLGVDGKAKLNASYAVFNYQYPDPSANAPQLEKEKVAEDFVPSKKPKSLVDFLK